MDHLAAAHDALARFQAGVEALPQVQLDVWHEFADGLVARTIEIPAGVALTGLKHKREHLNICYGNIIVKTDAGPKHIRGYAVLAALPGIERAGYTLRKTYWTTIHLNPGNERDLDRLENALVFDAHKLQSRRALEH